MLEEKFRRLYLQGVRHVARKREDHELIRKTSI